LNDAQRVLNFLDPLKFTYNKLNDIWERLPIGEHIYKHQPNEKSTERLYEVCGRKIGENAHLTYAYEIIKKFVDSYGGRAKQAAHNEGIDWKAVSHAFRAAYEVKQILTEGTITFPLKESQTLLLIKQGKLDYNTIVAPELEHLMDEIEKLSKESSLPEKIDRNFWNNFIINTLEKYCFSKD